MATYINAIGTATPKNCIEQSQIADFMCQALQLDEAQTRRLKALYKLTKIKSRSSVLADYGKKNGEFEFFPNNVDLLPIPTVAKRMLEYKRHALPLALSAIDKAALKINNFNLKDITHLITISCTGMYAPGIDIEIVQNLNLKTTIQRTCINFMGCYGAYNGLKMANSICNSNNDAVVLVVSVELCTLHFQKINDSNNLLSNAIFADGAGAVILTNKPDLGQRNLLLKSFYCDIFEEGKTDMAWNIGNNGFEMILSPKVPKIIEKGIGQLIYNLLINNSLTLQNIDYFAMHPGGMAILDVIEKALNISKDKNKFAYEILEKYGNMSSATVLFVIENLLNNVPKNEKNKNILSCAFGPGLTIETMLLELV